VLKVREGNLLVEFATIGDETATETEKTISVGLSNAFDDAMMEQHSEDPGDLSAGLENYLASGWSFF
jgi:hypothetical protein